MHRGKNRKGVVQGRIQKFFEVGVLKFFCMDGKIFFSKNPSKLKKFSQKGGGGLTPKTPPEYAPGVVYSLRSIFREMGV